MLLGFALEEQLLRHFLKCLKQCVLGPYVDFEKFDFSEWM